MRRGANSGGAPRVRTVVGVAVHARVTDLESMLGDQGVVPDNMVGLLRNWHHHQVEHREPDLIYNPLGSGEPLVVSQVTFS